LVKTGIVYHEDYLKHETGDHVENKKRLIATVELLNKYKIFEHPNIVKITPSPASVEEVERIHKKFYIDRIKEKCLNGGGWLDSDTIVSPESYDVALLAVGGGLEAADKVVKGEINNAFCLIRPPGHHAGPGAARGFCLFNNIAIVARSLIARHKNIKKVMILDHDAHAGNGTSQVTYHDPNILLFDFHQHPRTLYPGTGYIDDIGEGEGKGYNINLTMVPRSGDTQYLEILDELFTPIINQFKPDILLISAGFDTHFSDPLTQLNLTTQGYAQIIKKAKIEATKMCNGRIVIFLEGGYDLKAISQGILSEIAVLGDLNIEFPEKAPKTEPGVEEYNRKMISKLEEILSPYWKF